MACTECQKKRLARITKLAEQKAFDEGSDPVVAREGAILQYYKKVKNPPDEYLVKRKAACLEKLNNGTLLDSHYCPYCGVTMRYYCKKGCKQS